VPLGGAGGSIIAYVGTTLSGGETPAYLDDGFKYYEVVAGSPHTSLLNVSEYYNYVNLQESPTNSIFDSNNYLLLESFFRFVDVNIPQGAEIISAYLMGAASNEGATDLIAAFQDAADGVSPTSAEEFDALSLTSGIIIPSFRSAPYYYSDYRSANLASELQKVIDRVDWNFGNSVLLTLSPTGFVLTPKLTMYTRDNSVFSLGGIQALLDKVQISGDGGSFIYCTSFGYLYEGAGAVYFTQDSDASPSWDRLAQSEPLNWLAACTDYDGSFIGMVDATGRVYVSFDSGDSWSESTLLNFPEDVWTVIRCDEDGSHILVCTLEDNLKLYLSSDFGSTWAESTLPGVGSTIVDIELSLTGSTIVVARSQGAPGAMYVSTDFGDSWSSNRYLINGSGKISISYDGSKIVTINTAGSVGGGFPGVKISSDYGVNWASAGNISELPVLTGISVSGDGGTIAVSGRYYSYDDFEWHTGLWVTEDDGDNWYKSIDEVSDEDDPKHYYPSIDYSGENIITTFNRFSDSGGAYFTDSRIIASSVGINQTRLVIKYNSNWAQLFDSGRWREDYKNGVVSTSWDAPNTDWLFNIAALANGGIIQTRGDWAIGFRPSRMRITHNRSSATNLNLLVWAYDGLLAYYPNYSSGAEVLLTWVGRSDLWKIEFEVPEADGDQFSVAAIEFYVGAYYSGAITTTTTTSTYSSTSTTETGWTTTSTSTVSTTSSTASTTSSSTQSSTSSTTSTSTSTSTMTTYTWGSTSSSSSTTSSTASTTSTTTSTISTTSSTASTTSSFSTTPTHRVLQVVLPPRPTHRVLQVVLPPRPTHRVLQPLPPPLVHSLLIHKSV